MAHPVPTSSEPARSRRALLAAAAGGLAATAASVLGGPARTLAAHLPGFGHLNNAGSDNTTLTTNSTGTALLVQQNGTGTALRGVANNGIAGFFTSANGSGVSGVVAANNKYGVYGGNDAATFGNGAAMRAAGQQNHGLLATTANPNAYAVRAHSAAGYAIAAFGSTGVVATGTGGPGVVGQASGAGASGVAGSNASEAFGYGVSGFGGNSGVGVRGIGSTDAAVQAFSGSGDGVLATSVSGVGVVASSGSGDGIVASAAAAFKSAIYAANSAAEGYGVYGDATGTTGVGVYGNGPSGGNYAGYFLGNVHVTGTLSKAAGSFKIDHPLDPANRYLSHSFVESPDMLNVYNGNTTTDPRGNVIVELPAWFQALNRDFRYQLTVIGQPAQAFVAEEIANSRFTIRTDKANVKVSWQVTGVRKDPYAEAHRIPVDERKPANERGTYLHPIEHGEPASKGLDARRQRPRPELVRPTKPPSLPDLPAGL